VTSAQFDQGYTYASPATVESRDAYSSLLGSDHIMTSTTQQDFFLVLCLLSLTACSTKVEDIDVNER